MKKDYSYIVVEGNIGAGKSTLAEMLAKEWNAKSVMEAFAENPFLPLFYQNPDKYSFQLEISFMVERFQQLKREVEAQELFHNVTVADYTFYKCRIFAGINLKNDEAELFQKMFQVVYSNLPKPDLLLYLYRPIEQLLLNIKKRGRSYEQQIQYDYLERIQEMYMNYFRTQNDFPVLIVNMDDKDFLNNPIYYQQILQLFNDSYKKGINYIYL